MGSERAGNFEDDCWKETGRASPRIAHSLGVPSVMAKISSISLLDVRHGTDLQTIHPRFFWYFEERRKNAKKDIKRTKKESRLHLNHF